MQIMNIHLRGHMKKTNSWTIIKLLFSVAFLFSMSMDATSKPNWTKEEFSTWTHEERQAKIYERMKNPPHLQEKKRIEGLREQADKQSVNMNYAEALKIWEQVVKSKYKTVEDERHMAIAYDRNKNYLKANEIYNNLIETKKANLSDLNSFLSFLMRASEDFEIPIEKMPKEDGYSIRNIIYASAKVKVDHISRYELDLANRANKWALEASRGQ